MKKISVIVFLLLIETVFSQSHFNTITHDKRIFNPSTKQKTASVDTPDRDKTYYTIQIKQTIQKLRDLESEKEINDSIFRYNLKYYNEKLTKSTSEEKKQFFLNEIKFLEQKELNQQSEFEGRKELFTTSLEVYKDSLINEVKNSLKRKTSNQRFKKVHFPVKEKFIITSKYGYRTHPVTRKKSFHNGIDIRAKETSIYPVMPGKITRIDYDDNLGIFVEVTHQDNFKSIYGHLSKILLLENTAVNPNTPIAVSGNTGRTTAPHLHLILKEGDNHINPEPLFN